MNKEIRILLIEDSEDDALLLIRKLKRGDYKIFYRIVDTPEDMKKELDENYWDIIISDYSIPGFGGLAALELLKKKGIDIPFIIVSGAIGEELAVEAMRAGVQDYIMKDKLARLIPAIERELREAKIRRDHREAKAALQRSERRYGALAEASQDFIYIINREDRVEYVNTFGYRYLGKVPESVIGEPRSKLFPPQIAGRQKLSLEKVFETGEALTLESSLQYLSHGSPIWIDTKLIPLKNKNGYVEAVLGVSRDITGRKEMEDALRESEKKYKELVDLLPQTVFEIDKNGKFTFTNRYGLETFGYTQKDFQAGMNVLDVLAEGERKRAKKNMFRAFRGERIGEEYKAQRKDGSIFPIIVYTNPIIRDGKPRGLRGIVVDITERKEAERKIRESEERYRTLVETSPDAITLADFNGNIIMANRQGALLHGFEQVEEIISGRVNCYDFIAPQDRERALLNAKKTLDEGVVRNVEYTLLKKDGTPFPGELSASLIRDGEGNPLCFIVVARDITERKKAEEEKRVFEARLQQSQKLESLGVLAGGIAHDFNNILTGILGYADLALMDSPSDSPARESIEQIVSSTRCAADLTRQMLAYSGKGKFLISPVNLSLLVDEMTHLLEISISKKCTLNYNFSKNLPFVDCDISQLRQIIMNLIINASDAIGEKRGVITISTGQMNCDRNYLSQCYFDENLPEGLYVYLEVADTGCGMTEEIFPRIFDPFFTTKFTGRGLGLAAVMGIVRGHKGAIRIFSEPGRGTTVRVFFSVSKYEGTEVIMERKPDVFFTGKGTVLVIDDEVPVRKIATSILKRFGFEVLNASGGKEGIEIFKCNYDKVSIVLLDMTMPDMDGVETFTELCRIKNDIKVILSSGYNQDELVGRMPNSPAGFIQKPYRVVDLVKVLQKVMSKNL